MSLLKRLFKKEKKEEDVFKDAPAFRQLIKDLEKEESDFIDRLEKILPVISYNYTAEDEVTSFEGIEHRAPESAQPVSFPVNFDEELSINLCIDHGTKPALLLNKHLEVAKDKVTSDQIVTKAYGNLFRQIEKSISISMISKDIGMLSGCNGLESSLVMVNEIWKLIRDRLKTNDIVFGIPAKDVFIFTSEGKSDAVNELESKINELYKDPSHPDKLSRKLYVTRTEGKTEIFRS